MNKEIYKSKTVWGIGIAGFIALFQYFGIGQIVLIDVIEILSWIFAAYGLRDAII